MKRLFVTLLVFASLSQSPWATPPFRYDSAVPWVEESVKSDIPKSERIYIVGLLKFTLHPGNQWRCDQPVRRIVAWRNKLTIAQLLKELPDERPPKFEVRVYRSAKPIEPVIYLLGEKAVESSFVVQASDVVFIGELLVSSPGQFPFSP